MCQVPSLEMTASETFAASRDQFSNGALHPVITPTIAYGKGFDNFDLQGILGIGLPTADTSTLGRTIAWNNAFQCRIFKKLWPEVELNSTFFQDGKNDGFKQNFVTPGLVRGRFRLFGRVGFTSGGGYQIATTRFHTSNHNAILRFVSRFRLFTNSRAVDFPIILHRRRP
jgi:hypothetical protein